MTSTVSLLLVTEAAEQEAEEFVDATSGGGVVDVMKLLPRKQFVDLFT
jgi:hypothetical protein